MSEGGGLLRGASLEQDARFSDKTKKLYATMKFPRNFATKVDMSKVKLVVIKPWISKRIVELLGSEDEVLIGYCISMLEQENPDPRDMQIQLTAFLHDKAKVFMKELWSLLISAQNTKGGIPQEFLDKEREELAKKQQLQKKIEEEIKKKKGYEGDDAKAKLERAVEDIEARLGRTSPSRRRRSGSSRDDRYRRYDRYRDDRYSRYDRYRDDRRYKEDRRRRRRDSSDSDDSDEYRKRRRRRRDSDSSDDQRRRRYSSDSSDSSDNEKRKRDSASDSEKRKRDSDYSSDEEKKRHELEQRLRQKVLESMKTRKIEKNANTSIKEDEKKDK